jgi:RNA polymerase sigma-70 factor, ECF subfamily
MDQTSRCNDESHGVEFVQLLTLHQPDIFAYLRSLVFVPDEAADILQDTNLVLWEKRAEFEMGTNFLAWAFQIARYKLLQHRNQHERKCLCFSDALIDELSLLSLDIGDASNDLLGDLRRCLANLPPRDRELIVQRYSSLATCERIANEIRRPVRWVYKALSRIRRELLDCVARYLTVRRGQ